MVEIGVWSRRWYVTKSIQINWIAIFYKMFTEYEKFVPRNNLSSQFFVVEHAWKKLLINLRIMNFEDWCGFKVWKCSVLCEFLIQKVWLSFPFEIKRETTPLHPPPILSFLKFKLWWGRRGKQFNFKFQWLLTLDKLRLVLKSWHFTNRKAADSLYFEMVEHDNDEILRHNFFVPSMKYRQHRFFSTSNLDFSEFSLLVYIFTEFWKLIFSYKTIKKNPFE